LGRPREPGFPDGAGRRNRASLASASGSRRITCSSLSRYVGLLSRARRSPRNGRSLAYTIIFSPFTSANICSSMAPCSTRAAAIFQYVVTMRYGALVLPRYAVRISSALDGVNCSRNQARAFRMTGSRRRSYSLSSRSALSYVVVTGGSVIAVVRKLRGLFPGGDPGVPRLLRRAHAQLLLMADQGHAEQQRLRGQLVEPALLREQCRPEAQLREAPGVAVDQGADTELLGEAAQLAGRGGPLVEIDEMGLDPTLGKEPQRGAGVGALPDTEDLHVHTSCRSRTARRPARRAPAAWLRASPPAARLPRRAARACASRPRALPRLRSRRRSSPRARAAATCTTTSRATACAVFLLPSTTLGSSRSNPSPWRTASAARPVTRASEREYLENWTMRS